MCSKMLRLTSGDGESFTIKEAIATEQFQTIKDVVEAISGGSDDDDEILNIPLWNVQSEILDMIIGWSDKQAAAEGDQQRIIEWGADFAKDLDQVLLYHVFMAADYLGATQLIDILARRVADMIRGKKAHEIRQIFNIKNDFTPEKEEEIRRKNPWAFE